MDLKAVLFDLWGTLIIDRESNSRPRQLWRAENVAAVLARHGRRISFEAVDNALVAAGAALSALHDQGKDVTARGRVELVLGGLKTGFDLPEEAWTALERAICTMHPVYRPEVAEGAPEVLRRIKELALPTALISNAGLTTAPTLREMLDGYGLAPYLDVCVFSDELEIAKPDAGIFMAALDQLGVEAPAVAFVGDSPHNDIFGARQAGLLAVQIGHRDSVPPTGYTESDGARPNARIGSLHELLDAISGFASLPG